MLNFIAVNAAKRVAELIKFLKLGQASALPGRVALAVNPRILQDFARDLKDGKFAFFVTGTNGKTTSTGILKQIILAAKPGKQSVICNDMGANLYYGICAELVLSTNYWGKLKTKDYSLELDEAAFVKVAQNLKPKVIVVTNIYRDQLDRFGEVDATQKLIIDGIKNALTNNGQVTLVLNADDNKVLEIQNSFENNPQVKIFLFNVKYSKNAGSSVDGEILNLEQDTHGKNISVDFSCEIQEEKSDYSILKFTARNSSSEPVTLHLPGLYNTYNATSAAAAGFASGIAFEQIKKGVEAYQTVFGRSEKRTYKDKEYQVFLIKNPTGCSEVVRHLCKNPKAKFLIAINDNYADGRDVSWLWDADFEKMVAINQAHMEREFLCSGHRAYDMATRLKYAGIAEKNIQVKPNLEEALDEFVGNAKADEELYMLPTYTVLLELNQKF